MKKIKIFVWPLFIVMFVSIVWAMNKESITEIPKEVISNPWFITTLVDLYIGFILFYLWICLREKSLIIKILWFFPIMLLGNLAACLYILIAIYRLPEDATVENFLLGNN